MARRMSRQTKWLLIGGGVIVVGGVVVYAATRPAAAASPAANPAPIAPQPVAATPPPPAVTPNPIVPTLPQPTLPVASPVPSLTPAPGGTTYVLAVNQNTSVQLHVGETVGLQFPPSPCGTTWRADNTTSTVATTPGWTTIQAVAVGNSDITYSCTDGQKYNVHVQVVGASSPLRG